MFINHQKCSECQLVTVINAAIHLGEPSVDPESDEYDRLIDLVGARYGSAIRIEKAIEYLRLDYTVIPKHLGSIKSELRKGHPVEVVVWHPRIGLHSCLIVGYKNGKAKVTNFKAANKNGWIRWKDMKWYVDRGTRSNIGPTNGYFRSFKLSHMRQAVLGE